MTLERFNILSSLLCSVAYSVDEVSVAVSPIITVSSSTWWPKVEISQVVFSNLWAYSMERSKANDFCSSSFLLRNEKSKLGCEKIAILVSCSELVFCIPYDGEDANP